MAAEISLPRNWLIVAAGGGRFLKMRPTRAPAWSPDMPATARPQDSLIAVSCPGGIARQFRVQIASSETSSHWQLVGSFRDWRRARDCAAGFERAGHNARIIDCRTLPTAT